MERWGEREMEGDGERDGGRDDMRWEEEIYSSPAHTMETESFVDIY